MLTFIDKKPRRLQGLDLTVLAITLTVVCVRAFYTETTSLKPYAPQNWLSNPGWSLLLSSVFILAAGVWLFVRIYQQAVHVRPGRMGPGLVLFIAGGAAAAFGASNHRDAITETVTVAAPILAALLWVQLLDRQWKIRMVLMVLAGLGAATAYECLDQKLDTNTLTIEQYEQNPKRYLDMLGYEENTVEHFMLEHRIYSQDIKGFLKTSNSAGSFLLLTTGAALMLLVDAFMRARRNSAELLVCTLVTGANAAGLILTESKGAIGGAMIAGVGLLFWCRTCGWMAKHRKALLTALGVLAAVLVAGIVWYGTTYNTLPGGKSMRARWEYWQTTAQMIADHPVQGVGGGSFPTWYLHYKDPEAMESVRAPHNWILNIHSQFGVFGLAGYALALAAPLIWLVFRPAEACEIRSQGPPISPEQKLARRRATGFILLTLLAALGIVRPFLTALFKTGNITWVQYLSGFVILIIIPAGLFALGFAALWIARRQAGEPGPVTDGMLAVGVAAVTAVCIHNLIDFAMFEPAVLTALWLMIAVITAAQANREGGKWYVFTSPYPVAAGLLTALVVVAGAYLYFAVWQPVYAGAKIHQALRTVGQPEAEQDEFLSILAKAYYTDPINPVPYSLSGQYQFQKIQHDPDTAHPHDYDMSAVFYEAARKLDPAHFVHYENIAEVYTYRAEQFPDEAEKWNRQAYEFILQAIERYPNISRLHLKAGALADKLGRTSDAIAHYQRAVEIEDLFRARFAKLYPDREVISRMGRHEYQHALQRIEQLKENANDL